MEIIMSDPELETSKKLSELFSSFAQFIGQMTTSVQGSSVGRDTGSRAPSLIA